MLSVETLFLNESILQIETYSNNLDEDNVLLHYASCQIKVFKVSVANEGFFDFHVSRTTCDDSISVLI